MLEALAVLPELPLSRWLLGGVCAFFVGMAKTGVPGLGILVVPLMVLTVGDARQSAGWLLPLLCTADLFAVVYYRRHAQTRRLFSLVPWVLVGMGAGALALSAPETYLRPAVGVIVLVMIVLHLRRKAAASAESGADPPAAERWPHAAGYGVVAGFATTVANAAGPVMNLYLLAKRLPKHEFIATGAWYFLVINLAKVPVYAGFGLIGSRSLLFDLVLLPAVVAGALCGRSVFARLPQRMFETVVLGLTVLAALLLVWPR